MVSNFQFNHKQLGLTYPQAIGLSKFEVENFFLEWQLQTRSGKVVKVDRYLIALEHHQATEEDKVGGIHYHVYLKFNTILRSKDSRIFDIEDLNGAVYHPHIDKVRGLKNMIKYLTKEDEDPAVNWDFKKVLSEGKEEVDFASIYEMDFKTPKEFLDYMKFTYPKYYTSHYIPLKAIAYDNYDHQIEEYVPKYTVFANVPFACKAWVDNYLHGDYERPLALVLIGTTRTGKTEWARSLGRHMYMSCYFNLSLWDDEAEYIIFDDMDIPGKNLEDYFRSWKCFFGAQKEFTLCDKYKKKQKVHWGKPMIYISNDEIQCNTKTMDYIRKNSVIVNVYNTFY